MTRELSKVLVSVLCGLEVGRDKGLDRELGDILDLETGKTGENGKLASNVGSVEVIAGVGLLENDVNIPP